MPPSCRARPHKRRTSVRTSSASRDARWRIAPPSHAPWRRSPRAASARKRRSPETPGSCHGPAAPGSENPCGFASSIESPGLQRGAHFARPPCFDCGLEHRPCRRHASPAPALPSGRRGSGSSVPRPRECRGCADRKSARGRARRWSRHGCISRHRRKSAAPA